MIPTFKIDHCGDGHHSWPHMNQSWILFREGFDECVAGGGRPMVMSVEYCTVNVQQCVPWFVHGDSDHLQGCASWLAEARADLWRIKSDIGPSWSSILAGAECSSMSRELSVNFSSINPRYGFNDPDIMEIGNSELSFVEQKSHFSLWCILAAPLLISTDLVAITNATLSILTAKEVIAVNQDPLGVQGLEVNCTSTPVALTAAADHITPNLGTDANCSAPGVLREMFPVSMNDTQCMKLSHASAHSY